MVPARLSMLSAISQTLLFGALRLLVGHTSPVRLQRLGSGYGGWVIPIDLVGPESTVYSAGVGEDVTFDLELIRSRGCRVDAFDPTPRAATFVDSQPGLPTRFRFHPYGLWEADGQVRFFAPANPAHVSHSIENLQHTDDFFLGSVKTLRTAMAELGHERIDLLKMDIEGAEYAVIKRMLRDGILPAALCVELEDPWPFRNVELLLRLRAVGYRLVSVDGRNVTLVRGAQGARATA